MKNAKGREWNTQWGEWKSQGQGMKYPQGRNEIPQGKWKMWRAGNEIPKGQRMKYPEGRNDIPHGRWKMRRAGNEMPPKATRKWLRHFISYFYWGDRKDCAGNCLCFIIKVVGTTRPAAVSFIRPLPLPVAHCWSHGCRRVRWGSWLGGSCVICRSRGHRSFCWVSWRRINNHGRWLVIIQ